MFVYGTLMFDEVLLALLGRVPAARRALLVDHARLAVRGAVYPGVVPRAGTAVEGLLLDGLTASELQRLDDYESSMYERQPVEVECDGSRACAQAWIVAPPGRVRLLDVVWDVECFAREHLADYAARCRHYAARGGISPGA